MVGLGDVDRNGCVEGSVAVDQPASVAPQRQTQLLEIHGASAAAATKVRFLVGDLRCNAIWAGPHLPLNGPRGISSRMVLSPTPPPRSLLLHTGTVFFVLPFTNVFVFVIMLLPCVFLIDVNVFLGWEGSRAD